MLTLEEATRLHLEDLAARGASPLTLRQYGSIQRGYRDWVRGTTGVEPTTEHLAVPLVRRWTLHLAEHGRAGVPCGAQTRSLYAACLKSLAAFLSREDAEDGVAYLRADPLTKLKAPRRRPAPPEVLSHDEFARLLALATTHTRWPLRMRAILLLLHSTGLRIAELCELRLTDVTLATEKLPRGGVRVRRGKGDKARTVPVPFGTKTSRALSRWLGHAGGRRKVETAAPYLFVDQDGTQCRPAPLRRSIARLADLAGIADKTVRPHTFRRTAATNWARAGVPLPLIAEWLGHSSLEQAKRYVRVAELLDAEYHDPVDSWAGVR